MTEMFLEIGQALRRGQALALTAIISDSGSTPRGSGSKMIVYPDGAISGTIGGGAVEGDVIARARRRLETRGAEIASYDLTRETNIDRMDLICGGRIQVLIERVPATEHNIDLYHSAQEELNAGRSIWWVGKITDADGQLKVARALHTSLDEVMKLLHVRPEAQRRLLTDQCTADGSCCLEFGGEIYVIESVRPPPRLFLLGAGHVSKEIAALSPRIGLRTIVVDDREAFANAERFPEAHAVRVCPGFNAVFNGLSPLADDFIVIVTRGHRFDKEVLAQALETEAGYIGMIGSRRKKNAIYRALIDRGVPPRALEQVHCPIGLAIGAETPAEIAVSVVAQLIQHRARRPKHA